jgi:hypothetical protein
MFIAALTTILVAGFLALTTSDSASANHYKKGAKTSVVANVFNVEGGRTAPPLKITCHWSDNDESYICLGKHFSQPLTNPSQDDASDYLPRGAQFRHGDVANPHEFSCERKAKNVGTVKPSNYNCSYGNNKFRLNQMVYMNDPEVCDPSSMKCIEFALPPK